jgi:1A family penicillin-binding protein
MRRNRLIHDPSPSKTTQSTSGSSVPPALKEKKALGFSDLVKSAKKKFRWPQFPRFSFNSVFGMKSKDWQHALGEKKTPPEVKKLRKINVPRSRVGKVLLFPIYHPVGRGLAIVIFLAISLSLLYVLRDLPSPRRLTSSENYPVSTQIFDRHGKLLYEIFADEHRIPISIKTLPPHVYQATIAIEDQNFYHHFGFDIIGIIRALRNTLQGKRLEGGSTITQQLVKNALLTRERSLTRKIKEGVLAIATEVIYTKEEILEMYLNYISYGGTSVGIEAASEKYFDKPAKDLSIAEAAMLAGLPQSPSRYSPFGSSPEEAKNRQHEVLRRMVEDKYITPQQAEQAKNEVLKFAISKTDIEAPHFVFYVRDYLYEKYGVDKVEKGGLRVTTTLDLDLQNIAQASLSAEIQKLKPHRVGNGASLIVKPNTGEILAMIGSKDYFNTQEDGQVNVTLAHRQPGSSIKPIMYATAFQNKLLNPGSYLLDIPTCFTVPGQQPYCPKNYDGSFHGPVSIRFALGNSLNIPAVKSLRLIGVENFIDQATKMGITTWKDPSQYGLSLTLGGGEIRMIDLAQAFTVLADQGVKVPLTSILKIEDYRGNVIEELNVDERKQQLAEMNEDEEVSEVGNLQRVMNRAPAYLTSHIMQDNNARTAAFGPHSKLVIPNQIVSAKTGTTNDLKDNWTVGFTPEFLTIVWVGNNDGSAMNRSLVSGITGAAPIFNDIMSYVLKNQEPLWQEKPKDVLSATVCVNGFPPKTGEECSVKGQELYWKDSKPSLAKYVTKDVWIHPDTGQPLKSGESTDGLTLEKKTVLADPFTPEFCLDCARAVTPEGEVMYDRINVSQDYVIKDTNEAQ